jgi:hypothetical protein
MRIPYVIDNIECRLADVLNYLLQREHGQQVDVATAYFSIAASSNFDHSSRRTSLPRLLLGISRSKVKISVCALIQRPICVMNSTLSRLRKPTLRLVEELIVSLRRDDVDVRLYLGHAPNETSRHYFLHAKCYSSMVVVAASPPCLRSSAAHRQHCRQQQFTGPGLISNRS